MFLHYKLMRAKLNKGLRVRCILFSHQCLRFGGGPSSTDFQVVKITYKVIYTWCT